MPLAPALPVPDVPPELAPAPPAPVAAVLPLPGAPEAPVAPLGDAPLPETTAVPVDAPVPADASVPADAPVAVDAPLPTTAPVPPTLPVLAPAVEPVELDVPEVPPEQAASDPARQSKAKGIVRTVRFIAAPSSGECRSRVVHRADGKSGFAAVLS
jgi:hypothetical protein